ncbi:unnamed protein product [Protopolystoma xenopodis]|uniref:Uncharacterized protein n=1 Tax=Protopolystoma xenopodis TaxID=117903 RepID=A0A3S5BTX4_9PLAT|nr:unnamed protein product [Protopolystoma xenopodis]
MLKFIFILTPLLRHSTPAKSADAMGRTRLTPAGLNEAATSYPGYGLLSELGLSPSAGLSIDLFSTTGMLPVPPVVIQPSSQTTAHEFRQSHNHPQHQHPIQHHHNYQHHQQPQQLAQHFQSPGQPSSLAYQHSLLPTPANSAPAPSALGRLPLMAHTTAGQLSMHGFPGQMAEPGRLDFDVGQSVQLASLLAAGGGALTTGLHLFRRDAVSHFYRASVKRRYSKSLCDRQPNETSLQTATHHLVLTFSRILGIFRGGIMACLDDDLMCPSILPPASFAPRARPHRPTWSLYALSARRPPSDLFVETIPYWPLERSVNRWASYQRHDANTYFIPCLAWIANSNETVSVSGCFA